MTGELAATWSVIARTPGNDSRAVHEDSIYGSKPHPRSLPRQEPPGRNRPVAFTLRYKVSAPPRSLRDLCQWTRGKEMEMIENCQNEADCSGVYCCYLTIYDKNRKAHGGIER